MKQRSLDGQPLAGIGGMNCSPMRDKPVMPMIYTIKLDIWGEVGFQSECLPGYGTGGGYPGYQMKDLARSFCRIANAVGY